MQTILEFQGDPYTAHQLAEKVISSAYTAIKEPNQMRVELKITEIYNEKAPIKLADSVAAQSCKLND